MLADTVHDALSACEGRIARHNTAISVLQGAQGTAWPNIHSHRLAVQRRAAYDLSQERQRLALLIHHRRDAEYVATLL